MQRIINEELMKKFLVVISLMISSSATAETSFYLNGLFSTSGSAFGEMPNSPGTLSIHNDGVSVTRKVTTCFSESFCGPELIKNETIVQINNNREQGIFKGSGYK